LASSIVKLGVTSYRDRHGGSSQIPLGTGLGVVVRAYRDADVLHMVIFVGVPTPAPMNGAMDHHEPRSAYMLKSATNSDLLAKFCSGRVAGKPAF
jgi:hypothetical protein